MGNQNMICVMLYVLNMCDINSPKSLIMLMVYNNTISSYCNSLLTDLAGGFIWYHIDVLKVQPQCF